MINLQIKRKRPRVEIVPMIDVMFFMLVFFLLFSTLKSAQSGVEVELPKTLHLGQSEQNVVIIDIDKEDRIFIGKERIDLGGLEERIDGALQNDPQTRIVIKPDAAVPYRNLIKVMDILAGVGVNKPLLGVDRRQFPRGSVTGEGSNDKH